MSYCEFSKVTFLRLSVIVTIIISLLASSVIPAYAASKDEKGKKLGTLKATWYTGSALGHKGAGGKLKSGKSIAINNTQRKAWKVKYGQKVYLNFPKKHNDLDGWYTVKDTGCGKNVVDVFYSNRSSVPKKFRRSGIVNKVKIHKAA